MLEITNARKRYGGTIALDGCSLSLRGGEWLGLLGPNGAGKTTLIRAIAGRVMLDGGSIALFGEAVGPDPRRAALLRSRLGVIPQELALYPTLTARENLEIFGRLLGTPRAALRERTEWALRFTGLDDRRDERVQTFSGGMKRRLNIGCGVLHRPELILLDEPTVGVDPQSRQRIWEMLAELRAGGAALLLTTHQLDEAQQLCDRIAIIDHGRTVASGSLRQLIAETVGRHHEVRLRLSAPPPPGLDAADGIIEGDSLITKIDDVAAELPPLLARLASAGCTIVDVHLSAPTLHSVFIALTGRELRE